MKRLNSILGAESFPEEYTYLLPREEVFAKFAAIAAYGGEISLEVASRLLGRDMMADKGDVVRWLEAEGMISVDGGSIRITEKGFKYYGAVFSLIRLSR